MLKLKNYVFCSQHSGKLFKIIKLAFLLRDLGAEHIDEQNRPRKIVNFIEECFPTGGDFCNLSRGNLLEKILH